MPRRSCASALAQYCRWSSLSCSIRLPGQHLPHLVDLPHFLGRVEPHGSADVLLAQHDALPLELEQALAHEMPAGAVARHQRVFDQPRSRREAAEDDVFFQSADHLRLFFLARERGRLCQRFLRLHRKASQPDRR
jgi:hypothetical protein